MGENSGGFAEWAVVELMGHRRLGGRVCEGTPWGPGIRIDIHGLTGPAIMTQFYGPGAVYCLTVCDEATARKTAAMAMPIPVARWELERAAYIGEHGEDPMP